MKSFISFLCALVFGFGLALSGMISPAKVRGFLDITGAWDPTLAFVMAGALAVTAAGYAWLRSRGVTLDGVRLAWPTQRALDGKLVLGSALFGIGWGIGGYCPGPAIGSLAFLSQEVLMFVLAMLVGMWMTRQVVRH
jgi:uncharacterized protein